MKVKEKEGKRVVLDEDGDDDEFNNCSLMKA